MVSDADEIFQTNQKLCGARVHAIKIGMKKD